MQRPEFLVRESVTGEAPEADEAELVAAAKEKSPQAWAIIFDLYYRRILAYAEARVGDRSVAEDLAATVFLQAVKSIKRYVYRGKPLLAWLYGIATNVVNSHRRTVARRAQGPNRTLRVRLRGVLGLGDEDPAAGLPEPIRPDPGLSAELLDLRDAVEKLTPGQREVVVLHYFVGLKIPEVAAVLRKRERAVYSLQARALAALRKTLV